MLEAKLPAPKRRLEIPNYSGPIICPEKMATALHEAFGGELWLEGRLLFKDGKRCLSTLKVDECGD